MSMSDAHDDKPMMDQNVEDKTIINKDAITAMSISDAHDNKPMMDQNGVSNNHVSIKREQNDFTEDSRNNYVSTSVFMNNRL